MDDAGQGVGAKMLIVGLRWPPKLQLLIPPVPYPGNLSDAACCCRHLPEECAGISPPGEQAPCRSPGKAVIMPGSDACDVVGQADGFRLEVVLCRGTAP